MKWVFQKDPIGKAPGDFENPLEPFFLPFLNFFFIGISLIFLEWCVRRSDQKVRSGPPERFSNSLERDTVRSVNFAV